MKHRGGAERQVVLRRWVSSIYTADDSAADRVERESSLLAQLEATDIPAPVLIGSDPTGSEAGVPALVMSRVPGHIDLAPADTQDWIAQMAALLVRIHHAPVDAPPYFSWLTDEDAAALGAPTRYDPVFIHRDYQHFNLLWRRGLLTGIVDWVYSCRGPADVDVGHCRANLAALYSADLAEKFRLAYEAEAGRTVDPYWDLTELVDFGRDITSLALQVGGRRHFDTAGARPRVETVIAAARRRL